MQNMMQSFYGTTIFHFSYPKTTILLYFFFEEEKLFSPLTCISLPLRLIHPYDIIQSHCCYACSLMLMMMESVDWDEKLREDGELKKSGCNRWKSNRCGKNIDTELHPGWQLREKSICTFEKKIMWIKSSSYDYWCELLDRENSLHRCYFIYPVDIHGYKTMKWKTAAVKHWKICKQAYNEKKRKRK